MKEKEKIQYAITILALLTATIHLIYPELAIDAVTLVLIIIAIIPWLSPLFKSLELPGGLKFEFHDLEKVGEEAKKAGLIKDTPIETKDLDYSFLIIADQDPNLALAGLRIEIEKRLRILAEKNNINAKRQGVGILMRLLSDRKLLSPQERAALSDIIGTLNKAVHGDEYDQRIGGWVIENGPKILESLDEKIT